MASATSYPLLLVDAGNTAVKFATVSRPGATPRLIGSLRTAALHASSARKTAGRYATVIIASVVPAASRILRRAFPAGKFIGPRTPVSFRSLYDRKKLGADRLAQVAAARALHGKNVVVISCGTATVFDLIDHQGIHRGGAIAPGWKTFADWPQTATAALPEVSATAPETFTGRDTRAALRAGVAGGYAGMIKAIVAAMQKEAGGKKIRIIFTGGDARLAARLTGLRAVTDPLLTMRGLSVLARGIVREASKQAA
jgi:type III pantothenate kinase